MRSGGQILVDNLLLQGANTAFFVPGESFLSVLDAMFDRPSLRTIICRHEGSTVMMAEAQGRLTGRPGIAFVSKGPGATNAASGIFVACKSETPLILFVGLASKDLLLKSAFQSCNLEGLFQSWVKGVEVVSHPQHIPETLSRAFSLALQGRPGPVVIGLPEDVLADSTNVTDSIPFHLPHKEPSKSTLQDIYERLARAEQPLVVIGGSGWSSNAQVKLQNFAQRLDLPVAAGFRAQDYFDNRHSSYVGHLSISSDTKLATAVRASDLLLFIGAPLNEINTGRWKLIKSPVPTQDIIYVHPGGVDAKDGVRVVSEVACNISHFANHLEEIDTPQYIRWKTFRRDLRKAYETSQKLVRTPGAVQLAEVIRTLSDQLPETAIITGGAGNYSQFVHRYFTYKGFGTSLAPPSGFMGYGLPAAIAAQLLYPDRRVISFAGDGCFLMTAQELATAIQYDLPIIVIIIDNGMYGTIRMHQEVQYPGRISGTSLINPDFAAFARSFGALGFNVTRTEDFSEVLDIALTSQKPAVLSLTVDSEAITPQSTLLEIRKKASEKLKNKP